MKRMSQQPKEPTCAFGKERTREEYADRARWEREMCAACACPIIAQCHLNVAIAYETYLAKGV